MEHIRIDGNITNFHCMFYELFNIILLYVYQIISNVIIPLLKIYNQIKKKKLLRVGAGKLNS